MADVDLQRLIVSLEASFVKYDRAWQKAMGTTDANIAKTKAKFDGMEKVIGNAGTRTARGLAPVSIQTSNIAAQFQDIAVQLQAGQSPFTIALQQGTQLSAALGTGGLKGALSGLAAGFGAMINPVSLTTIAVIALGGAAVQYFSTLLNDGAQSAQQLKEQEDLVRRVADRWGEAVPALKAYVDQLDRAKEASDLQQTKGILRREAFAGVAEQLNAINDQVTQAVTVLSLLSNQDAGAKLEASFGGMAEKVRAGTATAEDFEALMRVLNALVQTETNPIFAQLQARVEGVASAYARAAREATNASAAIDQINQIDEGDRQRDRLAAGIKFAAEQERINGLTAEQLALETEIERVKADADRAGAPISEQQALEIAKQRLDAEERRAKLKADTKAGDKADTDADRERQAVLDLIAALEFEYDQLGLTAQQQAVANELRKAGTYATQEQRDAITDLVNKTFEERQQIDALNELYSELGQAGKSAVMGIVDAMRDGKVEASELGDILGNLLNQFGNFFLNQAFGGIGGGGGGNFFGSLFGGARAKGGPVAPGKAYLVGERGPELIVPNRSGYVVPNGGMSGMGGLSITIDARGAQAGVAEQIEARLKHWSRFEAPPLIRHHARTTMPENG